MVTSDPLLSALLSSQLLQPSLFLRVAVCIILHNLRLVREDAPRLGVQPGAMGVFTQQLRVLLWKNYTLKRRRPWSLLAEIIVPLFLFLLLAWVRTRRPATEVPTSEKTG